MTDKSAEALLKAVGILTNQSSVHSDKYVGSGYQVYDAYQEYRGFTAEGGADISFSAAVGYAEILEIAFKENNGELSKGWQGVVEFTEEIDKMIKKNLSGVSAAISKFSTDTLADELNAETAADTAKTKADDILAGLGISSN